MRMLTFAKRTQKEILRDPLTLSFGLGFPAILILLLSAIQANVPVPLFEASRLVPGMTVFGLSFMTLFSATLIAKDRESALLTRLYATPMRAADFILGYTLPLLPIALLQSAFCYAFGLLFGLELTVNILPAIFLTLPTALFFIALGLLFGSILTQKQVGGVCGALLTNLSAWLSGIWFDLELVGNAFQRVAGALPFLHATNLSRHLYAGEWESVTAPLLLVSAFALASTALAVFLFLRQMKKK